MVGASASPLGYGIVSSRRSQRQLNALLILLVLSVFWHLSGLPVYPVLTQFTPAKPQKHIKHTPPSLLNTSSTSSRVPPLPTVAPQPIATLIERAETAFDSLVTKETHTLASAAAAYRNARGRHPPPGFDVWYNFAKEQNAVMVEAFWDQIYHDLTPFWALDPSRIRSDARHYDMVVKVEDGKAQSNNGWFWHEIWGEMINTVSAYLPDMVIPLNSMDEPRITVPWEQINAYVEHERRSRHLTPNQDVLSEYRNWRKDDAENGSPATEVEWSYSTPYSLARLACPPNSAIREYHGVPQVTGMIAGPDASRFIYRQNNFDFTTSHCHEGFVSNYTLSTSLCHQPDLGSMHGALIQPLTSKTSQALIPVFGGSKFGVNNDILLPAPMHWQDDKRFNAGTDSGVSWPDKKSVAVWRGTATGGFNNPMNWYQFHRHRFVVMTNATKYRLVEEDCANNIQACHIFRTLGWPEYDHFAEWLTASTDVAFTDLMCDMKEADGGCWYTSDEFTIADKMHLLEQFESKYLPDIDGNSFSGRYRAFLLSSSLPIKATLYHEWYDSRLVAWKHFVPMDNRFGDFYGIMEYFRGSEGVAGERDGRIEAHDAAAEKIAADGKQWAEGVLRKEDMQIYVLRLLLEYARVVDDRRDRLAFVDDLKM